MKRSIWLVFIAILSLSLLLAGCKDSGKEAGGDAGTSSNGDGKDMLIFGRGGDSTSLDPITTTEGETFRVTDSMFENLVQYNEKDTSVEPALAKEWEVSADNLEYTFMLEQGVKFHDGEDFNAEAVVYNFERWMNGNEEQFPYYKMFGGFKGSEGHIIKELVAVDEYTVKFVLFRPQAPFLKNLAMSPFGMASPKALEEKGDDFREGPVGTGPYKFVEWKKEDKIVLEKFDDYRNKEVAKIKQIVFKVIPENSTRLNALINNEIDLMDGLNPSDKEKVTSNDVLQLIERPSMNVAYIGLNFEEAPFDNKKVRQALNMAVNKQEIIDAFYAGGAIPAKNPMPPSIEGYNDAVQDYEYDIDAAKKLLTEAGYADGFEMDLWYMPVARPYMPEAMKVAEVLQAEWKKLGVDVKLQTVDWATYLDKARDGELNCFMLGWTGDNGDPDNFLYTLLDKNSIGSNNYSRYANDEVHELLIEAQTETDQAKRNELYKQAQVIIKEDAPWITLVHSTPLIAGVKELGGYVPHPTGSESFANVYFK